MRIIGFAGVSISLALVLGAPPAMTAPRTGPQAPAVVQAASPTDTVEFSVFLPLRHRQELDALLAELHDSKSANYQHWLEPSEFLSRFGPSTADLASVKQSLTAHGFTIINENSHGMRVRRSCARGRSAWLKRRWHWAPWRPGRVRNLSGILTCSDA